MLVIAGGKGGCGKTTTALGLAAVLAERGAPAVVADADRDMPDLHALAGVDREPTLADAAERGSADQAGAAARPGPADPPGAAAAHPTDDVRVLPAPKGLATDAAAALSATAPVVDVVDCPAGAGPDAAGPLRVADRALLVARPTRESVGDALKTAAMARELDCRPVGAVLTGTDSVPERLAERLGVPGAWPVPEGGERPLSDAAVRAAYRRVADVLSA
jgi:septum site-determining protein MinD